MIKWELDGYIFKDSSHRRTPEPVLMSNNGCSVLQPKYTVYGWYKIG